MNTGSTQSVLIYCNKKYESVIISDVAHFIRLKLDILIVKRCKWRNVIH